MLRDEIKALTGNKRKFLLYRIVDFDVKTSRELCGIKHGTYNTWLQDPNFVELYRRRNEFSGEYKQEAIRMLRRDNQLAAVMLEGKILNKMKEEIEAGVYALVKTNLAREVYSKLINDLDYQPQAQSLSWEQRVIQLFQEEKPQIETREVIEGVYTETVPSKETEPLQGFLTQEGEQSTDEAEE